MPRKPRLLFPASFYHVMLRGNAGQNIFMNEKDREYFYSLIKETVIRFRYRVHLFCLMTNHIHLVIETSDVSLSKIIQNLAFRYTRWINKRLKRRGHLFQGRFKSILIDQQDYLLTLCRYIHLNPIKAKLVNELKDYRWSSHRVYLGIEDIPWVSTEHVLHQFSSNIQDAKKKYRRFLLSKMLSDEEQSLFDNALAQGRILGSETFTKEIFQQLTEKTDEKINLDTIINKVCTKFDISIERLNNLSRVRQNVKARVFIASLSQTFECASLSEVANRLHRDLSTLSNHLRLFQNEMRVNKEVAEVYEAIKWDLKNNKTTQA